MRTAYEGVEQESLSHVWRRRGDVTQKPVAETATVLHVRCDFH